MNFEGLRQDVFLVEIADIVAAEEDRITTPLLAVGAVLRVNCGRQWRHDELLSVLCCGKMGGVVVSSGGGVGASWGAVSYGGGEGASCGGRAGVSRDNSSSRRERVNRDDSPVRRMPGSLSW